MKYIVRKSQSTKLQKLHLTSYQKTKSQGKLLTVKQLNEEFKEVLAEKKKSYSEYREAKKRIEDYVKAKHNIDEFMKQEQLQNGQIRKNDRHTERQCRSSGRQGCCRGLGRVPQQAKMKNLYRFAFLATLKMDPNKSLRDGRKHGFKKEEENE